MSAFYEDPVAHATETEFAFLLLHFHQLKAQRDAILRDEIIADFHLGKDLLYANLNLVPDSCLVQENDCVGKEIGFAPAGRGIHATLQGNRIQGNNVTGCQFGYEIDAAGNFIAGNCARSNSVNYQLAGTQTIGPIIVGTAPITTNNPWANFEY